MGKNYEVQFAKQLDGTDNYGNVTYSVKFTTESDSVLWSVDPNKTTVEAGTQVFGTIEDKVSKNGKPYRKFKKEIPEGASGGQSYSGNSRGGYTPKSDDRGDGMRQGMAINNACAYVNALGEKLSPEEYVSKVRSYAKLIYTMDLKSDSPADITDEELNKVEDIFRDLPAGL